jgi:hypothetical protein
LPLVPVLDSSNFGPSKSYLAPEKGRAKGVMKPYSKFNLELFPFLIILAPVLNLIWSHPLQRTNENLLKEIR